jgi:hypothetical protein
MNKDNTIEIAAVIVSSAILLLTLGRAMAFRAKQAEEKAFFSSCGEDVMSQRISTALFLIGIKTF